MAKSSCQRTSRTLISICHREPSAHISFQRTILAAGTQKHMCAGFRPCALRAVGQLLGFRASRPKTSCWYLPRLANSSSSQAWLRRAPGALPHPCAWLLPFSQPAPYACAFFSKIVCQSFPSCFLAQLPGDPKNAPWGPRHIAFLGNLPATITPKVSCRRTGQCVLWAPTHRS